MRTIGVVSSGAAAAPDDPAAGVSPDRAVRDRFGVARKLDCRFKTESQHPYYLARVKSMACIDIAAASYHGGSQAEPRTRSCTPDVDNASGA